MTDDIKTVEIPEPVNTEEVQRPSVDEAKAAGWSEKEIESAKKRGMLTEEQNSEDKAKKEAEDKVKSEAEAAAKAKAEGKSESTPKEEKKPPRSTIPDFEIKDPEKERVFLETFGPGTPQRAMYFRMKNERQSRQAAEARVRELEARLQVVENPKPVVKQEVDEEGNPVDPEERPLTLKQLRAMQEAEAKEIEKRQAEQQERAARITDAQQFQEEYARSVFPDFDDTVKMAADVMKNIDTIVPEKWKQARVISLIRELQVKAANADKIGVDEDNAAFIAYEIGKFHPEYGKKPDGEQPKETGTPKVDPKANGGLTPEQMKRAEQNTQRRASSASVPSGGGRRAVTVEEVTAEDLNRMNYEERSRFKRNHPEQYAKLLRG